jgi:hypothetical protein
LANLQGSEQQQACSQTQFGNKPAQQMLPFVCDKLIHTAQAVGHDAHYLDGKEGGIVHVDFEAGHLANNTAGANRFHEVAANITALPAWAG